MDDDLVIEGFVVRLWDTVFVFVTVTVFVFVTVFVTVTVTVTVFEDLGLIVAEVVKLSLGDTVFVTVFVTVIERLGLIVTEAVARSETLSLGDTV